MFRRFASFRLPRLPFQQNSLEPEYDAHTLSFHHGKHHQAYVDKLNAALPDKNPSLVEVVTDLAQTSPALRNNGGGHYNHCLFWLCLGKTGQSTPSGRLLEDIKRKFGDFATFQEQFVAAGVNQFGSGWAWLSLNQNGELEITSTPNQDNHLMKGIGLHSAIPFFTLDVWEHAYYLQYQNRRPDFAKEFWNIVDWGRVGQMYEQFALQGKAVDVEQLLDQVRFNE